MSYIKRNFANYRGLVRTVLAGVMWWLGPYRKYGKVDWPRVKRLVFVCQGNICRSPFAHYLALAGESEIPVTSFGLATTTGVSANISAIDVAADFGLELGAHLATDLSNFLIQSGDLLIVMEDRHINQLRGCLPEKKIQICLLGLWCRPRFALLYDPFGHPREYFQTCFDRIHRAVINLLQERRNSILA